MNEADQKRLTPVGRIFSTNPVEPLFHYATISGLRGIIKSKSLWATDARFLNDLSSIRLTPLQQKYLRAMAELGSGLHLTGDIAATLGVEARAVATVRQQLINKGMIWSQRHGETAFTVPLFNEFLMRQMPRLEKHEPRRRIH
jgi:hypothetical protein